MNTTTCIIIPTLREHDNLMRLIPAIIQAVPGASILVVDDYSQDGSKELVEQFQTTNPTVFFLERKHDRGYGKSVLEGMQWARGHAYEHVVTMDADFSHDPNLIPMLLEKLGQADAVIGSRYVAGGGIVNWNLRRRILSRFANWYVRIILRMGLHDATSGLVAYNATSVGFLTSGNIHSEGYSFLVECKYQLYHAGYVVQEYPMMFHDRRGGASKMSWRVIWESVWLPWRLRFQNNRGILHRHG